MLLNARSVEAPNIDERDRWDVGLLVLVMDHAEGTLEHDLKEREGGSNQEAVGKRRDAVVAPAEDKRVVLDIVRAHKVV